MAAEEIFNRVEASIKNIKPAELDKAVNDALKEKLDLLKVMDKMGAAAVELGERYARGEVGLPEVLVTGKMLTKAINTLKPHFPTLESQAKKGTVIMGTIQTDVHSIGKNLVSTFLTNSGYEVYDLGEDVPAQKLVEKAKEVKADVIGVSSLLTTSMLYIKDVVEGLKANGMQGQVKVIIGGASVSPEFAESIGASAYGENASKAIGIVNKFMAEKRA